LFACKISKIQRQFLTTMIMIEPLEPPPRCMAISGFIVEIGEGRKHWLTKAGGVTENWSERGVWDTQEEVNEFVKKLELHENS
jgi:hypothetical protein